MIVVKDMEEARKAIAALETIIIEQGKYDETIERLRFEQMASHRYPMLLAKGWDQVKGRYFNGGLEKRWSGWKECAKAREIVR